jgi:transposase
LSSPKIAIHKKQCIMKTATTIGPIKRTQKDYSLSFKLQVVQEIESGELSIMGALHKYGIQSRSTLSNWKRKYGNFDFDNQYSILMKQTPEQRIFELEQQVKLLEKQKNRAELLAERADKKVLIFDMLVDMAEKEYDISIRKNYKPE